MPTTLAAAKVPSKQDPQNSRADFDRICRAKPMVFDLSRMGRALQFLENSHQIITSEDVASLRRAWDAWMDHERHNFIAPHRSDASSSIVSETARSCERRLENLERWINASMLSPAHRELLDLR